MMHVNSRVNPDDMKDIYILTQICLQIGVQDEKENLISSSFYRFAIDLRCGRHTFFPLENITMDLQITFQVNHSQKVLWP